MGDPQRRTGLTDGLAIPHLHRDKFLSIPCEKSGNVLHIAYPLIILIPFFPISLSFVF